MTEQLYSYETDVSFNFPNIEVQKILKEGKQVGWLVKPVEGYVLLDTSDNEVDIDPITGEEEPIVATFTSLHRPLNANFKNFTWVAIKEEIICEDS